jgi:thioredoxin 1
MTISGFARLSLLAASLLAVAPAGAFAFESKAYSEAGFKATQAAGKPSVVHVTAPWCPTCKAQDQAIEKLSGKPEFAGVTIYKVDFDSQKDVLRTLKATSQSTLIAFSGAKETGRVVGDTSATAVASVFTAASKK